MYNMKDIEAAGNKEHQLLTMSWDIIDICQYECSYCAAVDFNKHLFNKNDRNAYKIVIKRLSMKNFRAPFQIELIGGEPTLHPELPALLEGLNNIESCIRVELITNLAKPESYFEQFNDVKYNKVVVSASYHPEYYTTKFLDKCIAINNYEHINVLPIVNLSDKKEDWASTVMLLEEFDKNNIRFGLNFLIEVPGDQEIRSESFWKPNYTPEFFQYFKVWIDRQEWTEEDNELEKSLDANLPAGEACQVIAKNIKYKIKGKTEFLDESQIVEYGLHRFKGWKCDARMYYITMAGAIIHHCTREEIPITATKDDLFQPVICPLDCCDCDTKYHYYKERLDK